MTLAALLAMPFPARPQSLPLEFWIVFDGDTAVSFWHSRSQCRAVAATETDWTCRERLIAKPDQARAGWTWTLADGWTLADPRTDLQKLKDAARVLYDHLFALRKDLREEGRYQDAADVAIAHDIIWAALQAEAVVMSDSTRTIAQRIAWADSMRTGASDAATALEFYAAITDAVHPVPAPTTPTAWVRFDPDGDPEKCTLAGAGTVLCSGFLGLDISAATVPDGVDAAGTWIDGLTQ